MRPLHIPIYNQTMYFFDSMKDIERFSKKEGYDYSSVAHLEHALGFVGILRKNPKDDNEEFGEGSLIMLVLNKDLDVVIHEATHAALMLCDHVGINVDIDNQEPYAYLTAFIAMEYIRMFNVIPAPAPKPKKPKEKPKASPNKKNTEK